GQVTYEQRAPRPADPAHGVAVGETGERIIDRTTRPRTDSEFTGLYTSDLPRTEALMTGRPEDTHVLTVGEDGPGVQEVLTEEQMRSTLSDAQAHGRMPLVIWVDSLNEPFHTDSGGGSAGGAGAGHFVTITGYDTATGMVSVDNQWGDDHDHSLRREG